MANQAQTPRQQRAVSGGPDLPWGEDEVGLVLCNAFLENKTTHTTSASAIVLLHRSKGHQHCQRGSGLYPHLGSFGLLSQQLAFILPYPPS